MVENNNMMEVGNGDKFPYIIFKREKLIDISEMKTIIEKKNYTKSFLYRLLQNGIIDGIIIKKNVSKSEYNEFQNKYNKEFKFEYENNGGGLIIIYEFECTSIAHGFVMNSFSNIPNIINRTLSDIDHHHHLLGTFNSSILVDGIIIQPDFGIAPTLRQPNFKPTVIIEISISETLLHSINKSLKFIEFGNAIKVIIIKLGNRNIVNGEFKGFAIIIDKIKGENQGQISSVISFGSIRTTTEDEKELQSIINNTSIQIKGVVSNNTIENNTINTTPFLINGVTGGVPSQIGTNGGINSYNIDLFDVKTYIDKVPLGLSFNSIF